MTAKMLALAHGLEGDEAGARGMHTTMRWNRAPASLQRERSKWDPRRFPPGVEPFGFIVGTRSENFRFFDSQHGPRRRLGKPPPSGPDRLRSGVQFPPAAPRSETKTFG